MVLFLFLEVLHPLTVTSAAAWIPSVVRAASPEVEGVSSDMSAFKGGSAWTAVQRGVAEGRGGDSMVFGLCFFSSFFLSLSSFQLWSSPTPP